MKVKFVIELEQNDFVELMEILRKSQSEGVISWNASQFYCKATSLFCDVDD